MVLLSLVVVLLALAIGILIGESGNASPLKGPVTVVVSGSGATGASITGGTKTTSAPGASTTATTPTKTTISNNSFGS
jgi:hypothetical protein